MVSQVRIAGLEQESLEPVARERKQAPAALTTTSRLQTIASSPILDPKNFL
jgi:hypothetical protein